MFVALGLDRFGQQNARAVLIALILRFYFYLYSVFFMYMWVYCVNEEQQFQYVCGGLNFVHKKLWFAVVQLESELNQGAYGTLRVAFECKKKNNIK